MPNLVLVPQSEVLCVLAAPLIGQQMANPTMFQKPPLTTMMIKMKGLVIHVSMKGIYVRNRQ